MSPAQGPEQDSTTDGPTDDVEVPQEDALEQLAGIDDEDEVPGDDAVGATGLGEADEADVAEQARSAGGDDEDEYR